MGEIIAQYKSAAAADDAEGLLKAAEKLHSQYEVLVRTIRPVLPELELSSGTVHVISLLYPGI